MLKPYRCIITLSRLKFTGVRPAESEIRIDFAKRYFSRSLRNTWGQPCHATHPHIIAADEVTPRISKTEYSIRRKRLFDSFLRRGCTYQSIIPFRCSLVVAIVWRMFFVII